MSSIEDLKQLAARKGLSLLAIDESHCVSGPPPSFRRRNSPNIINRILLAEWGHDFRPEYRKLGQVRDALRPLPCMALTASATPEVQADIVRQLSLGITVRSLASVISSDLVS